jgi:cobalt-zinc-cadmium efflux system outer membrane protein
LTSQLFSGVYMHRQAVAFSVLLCLCAPIARPQLASSPFTVDQLVEIAVERNRDFRSIKERIAEVRGLSKQAEAGIPDNLEMSGPAGQPFGTVGDDSIGLTYSHTFETFGKRRTRIAIAQKEIGLAEAQFDERRTALAFDVKTRYADAAVEQQKLAVIERLVAINHEYLQLTETRVEKGDAAPLEADVLRVEIKREEAQRALTAGRLRSALLNLRVALDIPRTDPLTIGSSLIAPSFADDLERLRALAIRNRSDLATLRAAEEQSGAQTALASVETKPNLTLSGVYSHVDSAFEEYGMNAAGALTPIRDHVNSVGLSISTPLTTARRNRGNIEAAVARQTATKMRREYLESAIPTQVDGAYEKWRAAKEAADVMTSGVVQQSEKNLEVMRQAYSLGELRLIDVLNEQRRLLDTELSYVDTQADVFRAVAELEQAVGGSLR